MRRLTVDSVIRNLMLFVIAVRMLLSAGLLNNLVGYTSGQGLLMGRVHPATYLLVLPVLLFILRGRVRIFPAIDIALVLSAIAATTAARNGSLNMACVIVDTVIVSMIVARMLIYYGPVFQERSVRLMTSIALINLLLVVVEKITGQAIFPRDRQELFFRPQGLFDHPLFVGYICCFLMWAILRSRVRPWFALMVSIGLWLEVVLVSVRLPLLLASAVLMFQIIATGGRGVARVGAGLVAVAVLPVLISAAAAAGWLDRFFTIGLFDDKSAASRLSVFDVFDRMSSTQILWGMDQSSIDAAMTLLKLDAIESSFVAYTISAGIFVSIMVYLAIFIATLPVFRRDFAFLMLLIGMLLGSIALSTKTATMVVVFATAATRYGARRTRGSAQSPALQTVRQ